MSKKAFIILGMALFLCPSCSDSGKDDSEGLSESCNPDTYVRGCTGNSYRYCSTSQKVVMQAPDCKELLEDGVCASFVDRQTENVECAEDDEECLENTEELDVKTTCVSASSECSVENEIMKRCESANSGVSYIRTYQCKKTTDGRMFYRKIESTTCYGGYGVCGDNGECLPPIPCEDDFVNQCDGNMVKKCSQNRLRTSDCSAYPSPRTCAVIDDTPDCYASTDECTKEGEEIVNSCNSSYNREFLRICTRASNGKMYWVSNGYRQCMTECDAEKKACAPAPCSAGSDPLKKCRIQGTSQTYVDSYACQAGDEGKSFWMLTSSEKCDNGYGTCSDDGTCIPAETCKSKEFESHCDGEIAVTCTGSKVKYDHCDLASSTSHCAMMDDKAKCYADSNLCETVDEERVSSCSSATNKESLRICKSADNGKNYWISNGSRACENGCNAEGTGCKP